MYRPHRLPRLFLDAMARLRPHHCYLWIRAWLPLLQHPRAYSRWQHSGYGIEPIHALVLCMMISVLRFAQDPAVLHTASIFGVEALPHWLLVTLFVLGSGIGAVLIPQFWYWVLRIPAQHSRFIAAMIVMYAVVESVWDLGSLVWMPLVQGGWIAYWLPDLVKTLIITWYCSVVGTQLVYEQSRNDERMQSEEQGQADRT